ncbi:putative copper resistance protein D [Thiothrix eikelboomii]|uniref:Copper resistance protein D n=1 Tax=Thiothrix eikelboomii TaxID=92487 RepID=A0A1T4W2F2_9GAMM|nr:CopD family protein [Thiothrix eikelboomii]SKA71484.1 putative copper resistance protein D [Thiothrix eikelboomii]
MAEGSPWMVAIVLNKYLLYLAIAAGAGSVFMLTQAQASLLNPFSWRYGVYSSVLGLVLAIVDFFLQVGLFADAGLVGLADSNYIAMIWDSPLGWQFVFRVLGFLLMLLVIGWSWKQGQALRWQGLLASILALTLLCFAGLHAGHTVEHATWVHWALSFHFVIGLWWMGCLWPLALSCQGLEPVRLQQLMQSFGIIAGWLVPILLIAGLGLAYALTGSWQHLFTSAHGQLLLAKIALVAGLLGSAAYHKLKLVPQLTEPYRAQTLQRSIYRELGLGLAVLLLTAVLSSMVGPATLMN